MAESGYSRLQMKGNVMKKIFRVIMCVALFAGLPAFADWDKGAEAWKNGDHVTAVREWRLSAEQGDASGQYSLGFSYRFAQGVSQDYKKAVKWYTLAAEQGHQVAQDNLARMYANGYGVLKDYQEAVKLFRLSTEQGFVPAQSALGVMYYNGHGVPKNKVLAYMWANLAASKGDDDGAELRDEVEKEMTSNQISEAQKLSRECLAKDYKGC